MNFEWNGEVVRVLHRESVTIHYRGKTLSTFPNTEGIVLCSGEVI